MSFWYTSKTVFEILSDSHHLISMFIGSNLIFDGAIYIVS